jgi:hypothetical protein
MSTTSLLRQRFLEDNAGFHAFDASHQCVLALFSIAVLALILMRRASEGLRRAVCVGIAVIV